MIFDILNSLTRQETTKIRGNSKAVKEAARKDLSRELLDTFGGLGKDYLLEMIDTSFNSTLIKTQMKRLVVPYPILKRLITKLSRVYKTQPKRRYFLNGKEIVNVVGDRDESSVYVDQKTFEILESSFYSLENTAKIRDAERKVNLLNTCVYKVNNYDSELKLDYIENDVIEVLPIEGNQTVADKIGFYISINKKELWTRESYEIVGKEAEKSLNGNTAGIEQVKTKNSIGWAFAPFVVLRDSIPTSDFWDFKQKDLLTIVKQLCLSFTELRYLMRYTAFGLKYTVNLEVPDSSNLDPIGIWEMNSSSELGEDKPFEIGELPNTGKIVELRESILFMMSQLLYMYGINTQDLVSSAQKSSVESKEIDREEFKEFVTEQQNIWRLNEQNLFDVMRLVWNRDNSHQIDPNITLMVDYPEIDVRDLEVELRKWVIEIDNDVKTAVDWIMSNNKELTREQAEKVYSENSRINQEMGQNIVKSGYSEGNVGA